MDTLATITVVDFEGNVLHQDQKRYRNTDKASEENKMLRDLEKTEKQLQDLYKLKYDISGPKVWMNVEYKAIKNKLTVTFEQQPSEAPALKNRGSLEVKQITARLGKLPLETLREIELLYL